MLSFFRWGGSPAVNEEKVVEEEEEVVTEEAVEPIPAAPAAAAAAADAVAAADAIAAAAGAAEDAKGGSVDPEAGGTPGGLASLLYTMSGRLMGLDPPPAAELEPSVTQVSSESESSEAQVSTPLATEGIVKGVPNGTAPESAGEPAVAEEDDKDSPPPSFFAWLVTLCSPARHHTKSQ